MVPLGDVLQVVDRSEPLDTTVEYRILGVRLDGNGPYLREQRLGSEIAAKTLSKVSEGDFIYSRLFAWRGAFGVIEPEFHGAFVSNEFPTFIPKAGAIDVRFLNLWFKLKDTLRVVEADCTGSTPLTRNRYKEPFFLALQLSLPPLPEQRRIVAKVEELAAKIEEARGLRVRGIDENAALDKASVDHIYHKQLKECGPTTLAEVCTSLTDGDHLTPTFSGQGVPFIFVGNVSTGKLHLRDCKFVAEDYFKELSPLRKPRRGDVLYSAVGATLGVPVVVDTDKEFCFQRHIAILKPDRHKVLPEYMRHMMRSATVFDKAWQSTTGTAQPTIPLRGIRTLEIPVPSLPEQRRIVAYLDDLQAKVDAVKALQAQTQAELDALLPSILDKAFKGEL